jgi:hypothetical protein
MKQELKLAACFICALIALYLYMRPASDPSRDVNSQPPPVIETPPIEPKPVAAAAPPSPTPLPPSSIKQTGRLTWQVTLTKAEEWWDTGIPVIAGQRLFTRRLDDTDARWQLKINNAVVYDRDFERTVAFSLNEGNNRHVGFITPDLCDTIKLKIFENRLM